MRKLGSWFKRGKKRVNGQGIPRWNTKRAAYNVKWTVKRRKSK